jgi:hypothetical protein
MSQDYGKVAREIIRFNYGAGELEAVISRALERAGLEERLEGYDLGYATGEYDMAQKARGPGQLMGYRHRECLLLQLKALETEWTTLPIGWLDHLAEWWRHQRLIRRVRRHSKRIAKR